MRWRSVTRVRRLGGWQQVLAACLAACALASSCPGVGLAQPGTRPDIVIQVGPPAGEAGAAAPVERQVETLQQALDLVRELRRTEPAKRNIHVQLSAGSHRLERPIVIDAEHGGSHQLPLVIRGAAPGAVRILGSRKLEPAAAPPQGQPAGKARTALERPELSAEVRSYVRRFALPKQIAPASAVDVTRPQDGVPAVPFEIFDETGPLQPARWPNAGTAPGWGWSRIAATGGTPAAPAFTLGDARVQTWLAEPDLWAGAYWKYDWRYETHRITRIEEDSGLLTIGGKPFHGVRAGARVFVYHALAELDQPGEWYRDRGTNELLVWPRNDPSKPPALEISLVESAFQIKAASHVRLRDLSIEMTRGDAVVVKGGRDVVIEDCAIRWTGGRAAVFEDAAASGVLRSRITATGAGGVLLYGGNRKDLTPAGLFVLDSHIEQFARLSRTYAAAVEINGVGNTVSGNVITNSDHLGILFQGNDHLIERNEISRVMQDSSDGGAIYTGRDWTSRGTRIRNNFLHDIKPATGFETKGIYLDDMASGITVEGNVLLRVDQAVFIGGGRDNVVTGNVFVATEPAVHIDSRGLNDHKAQIENPASEMMTRLNAVPYKSPPWQARYPDLAGILDDQPGLAKRNILTGNLYLARTPYDILSDVDRRQQTLVPNLFLADVARGLLERASTARNARELGETLRGGLKGSPLTLLPYDALDRGARQVPGK